MALSAELATHVRDALGRLPAGSVDPAFGGE
jgi:hypothetical protein